MLNPDQIAQFKRDGYILGGQIVDDAGIEELRSEMQRVISDKENIAVPQPVMLHNMGKSEAPVWQIVNISDASPAFKRLVCNSDIAASISALMGAEEVRLWHDQVQYKPASTGGVNMWHQDAPYWPTITPDDQVTAWVALDDVDLENGCMSMVPGSHLWGNNIEFLQSLKSFDAMPDTFEGHDIKVKVCPVKKGSVHFHHALTWHGSSANISGRPRRAVALHYMSGTTRYIKGGSHLMDKFITSSDGQAIADSYFTKVWPRSAAG